jgi:hypothetical protein
MFDTQHTLAHGMFADVADDYRVHVVEADPRNAGVFYVGSYPYDQAGRPLHPDASKIETVWDRALPGARQISERQKRLAQFVTHAIFEPHSNLLHA